MVIRNLKTKNFFWEKIKLEKISMEPEHFSEIGLKY